jgi:hypothetical protein
VTGLCVTPRRPVGAEDKAFILGHNDMPAIIIELDGEAVFGIIQGKYLVLELRYVGA